MSTASKGSRIAGWFLLALVAGLMIFSGSGKVFGFSPPEVVEKLESSGLGDKLQLIGAGELITGVLLLVPRTSSLGVLLASSFWGGAILLHMSRGESYVFLAGLLVMCWVGSSLRNPDVMSSFRNTNAKPVDDSSR